MKPFFLRELTTVARTPAFAIGLGVQAALLAGFLLIWGDGMPVLPGATAYDQLLIVQSALLSVLLPWVVARCGTGDSRDDLVLLGAVTASAPSRMLLGLAAGRVVALGLVVFSAMPFWILATQMSGMTIRRAAPDIATLLSLCTAAALATTWCTLACRERLSGWLFATIFTAALWWLSRISALVPDAVLFIAVTAVWLSDVALRADARFRYLSEETA